MPENFQRVSPLADIAIQGRFGADHGAPGVTLSVRHPVLIAMVIARKGKAKALADALKNWRVQMGRRGAVFRSGQAL